jgi:hypothetical protein
VNARRCVAGLVVLLLALTLGGCMNDPDPADAKASLQSSRATVMAEIEKVGTQLATDGATLAEASGKYSVCSSAPTTSLEYGGGGKLAGDPRPVEERIDAAAAVLEKDGWKVVATSKENASAKRPYANLEKDGLRLSLNPDVLRGSDALVFNIVGECLPATKQQVGELGGTDTIAAEK